MGILTSDYHAMRDRLAKMRERRLASDIVKLHTPDAVALKADTTNAAPGIRIRQDSKPLMNGLEQEWFNRLKANGAVRNLSAQAMRFKLANGAWYQPDMVGWIGDQLTRLTAWECKGGKKMKGIAKSTLTLKVAAQQWPNVDWFLVWKDGGTFRQQLILP